MRSRFLLLLAAGCGLLAAACDNAATTGETTASSAPPPTPEVAVQAVESYTDLGGEVVDLALLPHARPYLGRAVAALDGGGFAVIDFAEGVTLQLDGPRVDFLAAAPDFQLRGTPAPLVIGAGGALMQPQAWIFLAEEGALVDVPIDPIATDGPVRALCAERATEALIDLLVFTDASLERWRVSDRGQERLAAERVNTAPSDQQIVACAGAAGEVLGVADTGATSVLGADRWGLQGGSDVAAVEQSDGSWAIVARPSEAGLTIVAPRTDEVVVRLEEGLNAQSTPAPELIAASTANFGGSFGQGVLVAAQEGRVNAFELGGLLSSAKAAIDQGS